MASILNFFTEKNTLKSQADFLSGKVGSLHAHTKDLEQKIDALKNDNELLKSQLRMTKDDCNINNMTITHLRTQIDKTKKNAKIRTLGVSAASLVVGFVSMGVASVLKTSTEGAHSDLLTGAVGVIAAVAVHCLCNLYMRW
jgi:outer membrane murein-binding lipoprotein Lpp